jgi:hypothetical protein
MQNLNICIYGPITYEKRERRGDGKGGPLLPSKLAKRLVQLSYTYSSQVVKTIFISASPLYLYL